MTNSLMRIRRRLRGLEASIWEPLPSQGFASTGLRAQRSYAADGRGKGIVCGSAQLAFGIFGKMDLVVPLSTIIDTMYGRVCPLYGQDDRRRVQLLGSAVPFVSAKSSFLITAGHILKAQGREPLLTWGAEGSNR
jgi:hypothetical protein